MTNMAGGHVTLTDMLDRMISQPTAGDVPLSGVMTEDETAQRPADRLRQLSEPENVSSDRCKLLC